MFNRAEAEISRAQKEIFTGERADHPEWISLADEFFPEKRNPDLKAKILYGVPA